MVHALCLPRHRTGRIIERGRPRRCRQRVPRRTSFAAMDRLKAGYERMCRHTERVGDKVMKQALTTGAGVQTQIRERLYVPRQYVIGNRTVVEERQLGEGGFAYVWTARDMRTNEELALKKMICHDKERLAMARREVDILERLPAHPNLVRYLGHTVGDSDGHAKEVAILFELCTGGHLLDLLDRNQGVLKEERIVSVLSDICTAVALLHTQDPPIQHRDLKVENVLLGSNGRFKLCDFGSWSDQCSDPGDMDKRALALLQDQIDRYTTMMYRPPEMVDFYQRFLISEKVDIWMIGCILFTLMFCKHPFQDESSLAIANARYQLPAMPRYSEKLQGLTHWLFARDPNDRPSALQLLDILQDFDQGEELPLPRAVVERWQHSSTLYGDRPNAPLDSRIAENGHGASRKHGSEKPKHRHKSDKSSRRHSRTSATAGDDFWAQADVPQGAVAWPPAAASQQGASDAWPRADVQQQGTGLDWPAADLSQQGTSPAWPVVADVPAASRAWATFDSSANMFTQEGFAGGPRVEQTANASEPRTHQRIPSTGSRAPAPLITSARALSPGGFATVPPAFNGQTTVGGDFWALAPPADTQCSGRDPFERHAPWPSSPSAPRKSPERSWPVPFAQESSPEHRRPSISSQNGNGSSGGSARSFEAPPPAPITTDSSNDSSGVHWAAMPEASNPWARSAMAAPVARENAAAGRCAWSSSPKNAPDGRIRVDETAQIWRTAADSSQNRPFLSASHDEEIQSSSLAPMDLLSGSPVGSPVSSARKYVPPRADGAGGWPLEVSPVAGQRNMNTFSPWDALSTKPGSESTAIPLLGEQQQFGHGSPSNNPFFQ